MTSVPQAQVIFYQDENSTAPVLEWLKVLIKKDRKGYANCVARIQQLASAGYELRRPAADYLRDGIYELSTFTFNIAFCTFLMVKISQFLLMLLVRIQIKFRV